jgi:hypothetical protein
MKMNSILEQIKKSHVREGCAWVFLFFVAIVVALSIKEDYRSKYFELVLGLPMSLFNNYTLNLNSLDSKTQVVNCTLEFKDGNYLWDSKKEIVFHGPLEYVDLSFGVVFLKKFENILNVQISSIRERSLPSSAFFRSPPKSINCSIRAQAVDRPEMYPFDKYFIMGAVACQTYVGKGKGKEYLHIRNDGEALKINSFISGIYVRYPTISELEQMRRILILDKDSPPMTDDEVKKLNNRKNSFALVLQRPLYLRIMTVILGSVAFICAIYIGFKTPFKDMDIHVIGLIIGLWGIRNILFGNLNIFFPTYFDYALLIIYVVVFAGIIFRKIKGKASE